MPKAPGEEELASHHDDLQPFASLQKILENEPAFAFGRTQIARSQNPAEPAISRAVLWIDERVWRAIDEYEPCAGNDPGRRHRLSVLARECVRAHDSGECIAVGDPDPGKPELGGARDHFLRMRGPAQERKICHRREFGEPRLKPDQGRRSSCVRNGQTRDPIFGPDDRSEPDQNKDRTRLDKNASAEALLEILSP